MAGPAAMTANIFARFAHMVVEETPPALLPMWIGDFRFSSLTMCASKLAIVFEALRCGGHSVQLRTFFA